MGTSLSRLGLSQLESAERDPSELDSAERAPSRWDAGSPLVAYQGVPGAFGEEAVLSYFGGGATPMPVDEFADVARVVLSGAAGFGVLPIENSLVGPVERALAVLRSGDLSVIDTLVRPIRLCLLSVEGARVEGLERIISHPVALGQCRRLQDSLPGAEVVEWFDTAGAARHVAELGDPRIAAVASARAAEEYGLEILLSNIEDRSDNRTKFVVVQPSGAVIATGASR